MRANLKWKLGSRLVGSCLVLMLTIGITSCDALSQQLSRRSTAPTADPAATTTSVAALTNTDGPLSEVNTPASISNLAPSLEKFQPQVRILSPKPDEILADDRVTVKLKVEDLPLFKQPELGLGNHVHVILDKETYQGVYDLSQPLVFKNLAAGTHTLRVFASRPWHESFKNPGAYALVTFHVLTKTADNHPDPQLPLLTYSRPAGTYGAEPIVLDYYLTNAPTHPTAEGRLEQLPDWRIRVTVNDQRFILDRWAPIYLQGFKRGKNWVRLELLDDRGNPIPNTYNDSVSIFTYDPQQQDSLAKLVRGEIDPNLALALVDPNYIAIQPAPSVATVPVHTPTPIAIPSAVPAPINVPSPTPTPSLAPTPTPIATPSTVPAPVTLPSPISAPPAVATVPITPTIIPSPVPVPTNTPAPVPTQIVPSPIAIVPVPVTQLSPSPIAPPPSPHKALVPIIVPPTAPSIPAPAPSAISPVTPELPILTPVAKPSPVAIPTPKVAANPPQPNPAPVTTPQPVVDPQPVPSIAPVPAITPAPPVAGPAVPVPQSETKAEKTWQTKTIEILNVARAKTRAFTNTIPAKAQRFGRNLRIWGNKAIELVQELRDRKIQASYPESNQTKSVEQ